jgi:hypothetical protein
MSSAYDIQIHTIYSADDTTKTACGRLRFFAVLTLVVALAWLYVTWWPMYKWVEQRIGLGELHIMSALMQDMSKPPPTVSEEESQAPDKDDAPSKSKRRAAARKADRAAERAEAKAREARRKEVEAAGAFLAISGYGWLTVMSLIGLWLVMAGAAGVSSAVALRLVGALVLPAGLLAAGGLSWYVWAEYQWFGTVMPDWVIPSMALLGAVVAASIGGLLNRRAVGLLRIGGGLVVFSAALSVTVIWLAVRWGQMPASQVDFALYAKVFGIQSAYGWLLLLGTMGLRSPSKRPALW